MSKKAESTSLLRSVRIENVSTPQPAKRSPLMWLICGLGLVLLLSAIALSLRNQVAAADEEGSHVVGAGTGGLVGHLVGGDRDSHGCIPSAGYVWCAPLNKCVRPWLVDKSLGCD